MRERSKVLTGDVRSGGMVAPGYSVAGKMAAMSRLARLTRITLGGSEDVELNLAPELSRQEVADALAACRARMPLKAVSNVNPFGIPKRLWAAVKPFLPIIFYVVLLLPLLRSFLFGRLLHS